MAKPTAAEVGENEQKWYDRTPARDVADAVASQVVLIAVPMPVFRALSDAAALRNMTPGDLLNKAVEKYLQDTDPTKETV